MWTALLILCFVVTGVVVAPMIAWKVVTAWLTESRSERDGVARSWLDREGYRIDREEGRVRFETRQPPGLLFGAAMFGFLGWLGSLPILGPALGMWQPKGLTPGHRVIALLGGLLLLGLGVVGVVMWRRRLVLELESRGPIRLTWVGPLGRRIEREISRHAFRRIALTPRGFMLEYWAQGATVQVPLLDPPRSTSFRKGGVIVGDMENLSQTLQRLIDEGP